MRKTLLIAAAALATSVISSQAQGAVYSQNIVGYVNIPVSAGVFSLQAPALDVDGTGTNNTIATVYPNPTQGDSVYVFNSAAGSYDILTYQSKNLGSRTNPNYVTNWFNGAGNQDATYSINPGEGVFYLPFAKETNTMVGVVLQGTLVNKYLPTAGKFAMVSSQVPVSGGLDSVLGYVPTIGDNAYIFANGSYDVFTFQIKNLGSRTNPNYITNWIDANSVVGEPVINVGQGFWLNPIASTTWVQVFTNN
jgi:hypothetical protein